MNSCSPHKDTVIIPLCFFLTSLQTVRPTISSSNQNEETVTRGGDITLKCEADGVPRPAISWMKDGRPLSTGRKAQILNEGQLLRIHDAQVADTGRYTCIAVNVAGQADRKYDVNVHGEKKVSFLYV